MANTLDDIGNAPGQIYDFLKRKYVSLTKPDEDGDYSSRKGSISRQQKLAEALSQMGAQEQAVYTAGGITAPVSPMAALARGLTSFGGAYLSGKAAADEAALKKEQGESRAKSLESFFQNPDTTMTMPGGSYQTDQKGQALPKYVLDDAEAMAAGPATKTVSLPDITSNVAGGQPSYADKVRMAFQFAAGDDEKLAAMVPALLAQAKPEEFAGSEYGRFSRDAEGNITQIQAPMAAKPSNKNPFAATGPDGQPGMFIRNDEGNLVQVPGLRPYTPPGTSVRIDMPKPDSAFSTAFGTESARAAMTTINAGRAAPGIIDSADRVIKVLTDPKIKPITGSFAETKLLVSKALYGDTPEAAATENLVADLARSTLDAIPASGLGGGQGFTERDKQFLIDASAGRIQQTKENLLRMAKLRKTVGSANIRNANRVMKQVSGMPGYENMSGLLQPIPEGPAIVQPTQDAAAVAWARANPKDPRSAAILKANEAP
jgi:hypothetical protein